MSRRGGASFKSDSEHVQGTEKVSLQEWIVLSKSNLHFLAAGGFAPAIAACSSAWSARAHAARSRCVAHAPAVCQSGTIK